MSDDEELIQCPYRVELDDGTFVTVMVGGRDPVDDGDESAAWVDRLYAAVAAATGDPDAWERIDDWAPETADLAADPIGGDFSAQTAIVIDSEHFVSVVRRRSVPRWPV